MQTTCTEIKSALHQFQLNKVYNLIPYYWLSQSVQFQ